MERGRKEQLPRGTENLGMTDIYYLDYSENFTEKLYGTLSMYSEISPDNPSLTAHNCQDRKGEGCCLTSLRCCYC